jgi:hypothetical protein
MTINARRFINSVASTLINVVIGAIVLWIGFVFIIPFLFVGTTVVKLTFMQCLVIVAILRAALLNFHGIKVFDEV